MAFASLMIVSCKDNDDNNSEEPSIMGVWVSEPHPIYYDDTPLPDMNAVSYSTFASMLKSCKTKPQRGLIGVASQFIGWYQMAMNMRAFRYATSNPYRVPTARYQPLKMAGYHYLMPMASA